VLAYLWLPCWVLLGCLPLAALCAYGALPPALRAWRVFANQVADPRTRLLPALQASAGHALSHGVLLSGGLLYVA
jgi:hypothetical protein